MAKMENFAEWQTQKHNPGTARRVKILSKMNSVTKIGQVALKKHFAKKPFTSGGKTYASEVIFSSEIIELSLFKDSDINGINKKGRWTFRIWSIEIGLLTLDLKKGQTLYQGIVRKLKKQQKEDVPSHIIITTAKLSDDKKTVTKTHIIYRLTEEQESEMLINHILPATDKRMDGKQQKLEKELAELEKRYPRLN